MNALISSVSKFVREEDAPTMVEYALTVSLIAIVAIVAVTVIGQRVMGLFTLIW